MADMATRALRLAAGAPRAAVVCGPTHARTDRTVSQRTGVALPLPAGSRQPPHAAALRLSSE
eukprot:gene14511-11321_t